MYQRKRDYIYWRPHPFTYSKEGMYAMKERIYASTPLFLQFNSNRFFVDIGIAVSCDFRGTYYSFSSVGQWKMDKNRSGGDWDFITSVSFGFGYFVLQKERVSVFLKFRNEQDVFLFQRESVRLHPYPYNTNSLIAGVNYKL